MNKLDFEEFLDGMITNEKVLLGYKREEYARRNADVLINFKQNAAFLKCSPEEVCLTYMMKHIQSISIAITDAIRNGESLEFEWETASGQEGLAQRFADARNYMLLLGALISEDNDADPTESDT